MKFGREYTTYMKSDAQHSIPECPYVEFKKFKKLLKRCNHLNAASSHRAEGTTTYGQKVDVLENADNESSHPRNSISCPHGSATISSASEHLVPERVTITEGEEALEDSGNENQDGRIAASRAGGTAANSSCPVCDAEFFPNLDKAVVAVVGCFNGRAKELLRLHKASGIRKFVLRFTSKIPADPENMFQVGNVLVSYGCMNAIAIRKLLKKYDKIHHSANGRAFKTLLQVRRVELLQSPLLIELGALAVNLIDAQVSRPLIQAQPQRYTPVCSFDDDKQTISCVLPLGVRLDFDLTCSVCLEIVFDPITLGCGHIFCNSCACAAASVLVYHGADSAKRNAKCPLCRQVGVYRHAESMGELWILVRNRCRSYYEERLVEERAQRVQEVKMYWERQGSIMTRG